MMRSCPANRSRWMDFKIVSGSPSRSEKSMTRLRCLSMLATWNRLVSMCVVPAGLSLARSDRILPSCDRLLPGARL